MTLCNCALKVKENVEVNETLKSTRRGKRLFLE